MKHGAPWTGRFSNVKHWDLLAKGVRRSRPCERHFAVFSTSTMLTSEVQRFWCQCFVSRPNLSVLKISFSWYLANIVENAVSHQGTAIYLVTLCDSPETSLEVFAMFIEKMKNVVIHLILFWFELQMKTQGKHHLLFLPAPQSSVRCCKIFVIEGFSKFMSFVQKNKTIDSARLHLTFRMFQFSLFAVSVMNFEKLQRLFLCFCST